MWQIMRQLLALGTTAFLTTQDLDEADQPADRITVLDRGRLVAEGTPDELKRRMPGSRVSLYFADYETLGRAAAVLSDWAHGYDTLTLRVSTDGAPHSLVALLDQVERHSGRPEPVAVGTSDLDDVFLAFTGGLQQETRT
jgi:ABC-2 type transport system ATP-binding protein